MEPDIDQVKALLDVPKQEDSTGATQRMSLVEMSQEPNTNTWMTEQTLKTSGHDTPICEVW